MINARLRRRFHMALLIIWLGPGLYVSLVFKHSLTWIVLMSWYAIVATHLSGFSAETPVEEEKDD